MVPTSATPEAAGAVGLIEHYRAVPENNLLSLPLASEGAEGGLTTPEIKSPFDKRLSTELGLEAFEVYQVELPPGAESVAHDHIEDRVEDVYVFLRGDGWVVVDDEEVPVEAGTFVAVTVESNRYVRGGDNGLVFVAVCGS